MLGDSYRIVFEKPEIPASVIKDYEVGFLRTSNQ